MRIYTGKENIAPRAQELPLSERVAFDLIQPMLQKGHQGGNGRNASRRAAVRWYRRATDCPVFRFQGCFTSCKSCMSHDINSKANQARQRANLRQSEKNKEVNKKNQNLLEKVLATSVSAPPSKKRKPN